MINRINIQILNAKEQRLADITIEDVKAEGFATLEEFKATWAKINGAWNPDQQVTAYEFHKVEKPKEQNTLRSYLVNRDEPKTEQTGETPK